MALLQQCFRDLGGFHPVNLPSLVAMWMGERNHGEPTLAFNYLGSEATCDLLHSCWWKCSHMVITRDAGKCSLPACSGCDHGVVAL